MKLWVLIAVFVTIIIFVVVVYALRPKLFDIENDEPFYLPTAYEPKNDPHELLILFDPDTEGDNFKVWRRNQLENRPQFVVNHHNLQEEWTIIDDEGSFVTKPERLMCRMGINGYLRGPQGFELASYNAYLKKNDSIYWLCHEWGSPSPGTIRERFFISIGDKVYASLYSTVSPPNSEGGSNKQRYNHLVYYRPHGLRIATDDIAIVDFSSGFQCFSDTLGISGMIRMVTEPVVVNRLSYCKIEVEMWFKDTRELGHGIYVRDE